MKTAEYWQYRPVCYSTTHHLSFPDTGIEKIDYIVLKTYQVLSIRKILKNYNQPTSNSTNKKPHTKQTIKKLNPNKLTPPLNQKPTWCKTQKTHTPLSLLVTGQRTMVLTCSVGFRLLLLKALGTGQKGLKHLWILPWRLTINCLCTI